MKESEARKALANWLKAKMATTPAVGTQTKLANKAGVSQSTVGRILREEVDTEFVTAMSLISAANGSFDAFITENFRKDDALAGLTESMFTSPVGRRLEQKLAELEQDGVLTPELENAILALADLATKQAGPSKTQKLAEKIRKFHADSDS